MPITLITSSNEDIEWHFELQDLPYSNVLAMKLMEGESTPGSWDLPVRDPAAVDFLLRHITRTEVDKAKVQQLVTCIKYGASVTAKVDYRSLTEWQVKHGSTVYKSRRRKERVDDNAACDVCGDPHHTKQQGPILFCDYCTRCYHSLSCLDPPVVHIPEGDWKCPACQLEGSFIEDP